MKDKQNIHGTGLVFDGCGVLIRGESGAGKSLLALNLIEFALANSTNALLVGDDRIDLFCRTNKLFMSGPETLRGKIELFGFGIIERPFVETSPINLVVDIIPDILRMPEERETTISMLGMQLARCPVAKTQIIGLTHQRMIVVEAIRNHQGGFIGER